MDSLAFAEIVTTLNNLGNTIYATYMKIGEYFGMSLKEIWELLPRSPLDKVFITTYEFILNVTPIGELTLFSFIFGSGVVFILGYSLVKWILDIVL